MPHIAASRAQIPLLFLLCNEETGAWWGGVELGEAGGEGWSLDVNLNLEAGDWMGLSRS